ncbi:MAG TPA: hypothetical protein PLN56_00850 [Methanoregulaceae archaeon]|nr:hypothetical protein [Methanoregulaceae archaeon]HPD09537.1 hypothetical protein [Methanoregulaceae archaeon]HRT14672.1 hypothetical protein [Methanoregulaceae archaeon]HRU30245.1 hypothetical protein [Methanoregulaceae archaeon]
MGDSALLVLEGPWWTPAHKPKRPSVLPFLEGLEKYKGNFNIYYSSFYEKKSFQKALEDDLTHTREQRLFLYIAAHGGSRMVGALESESGKSITCGMRLTTLLQGVRKVARTGNIEGVLLGSCTIGSNRADLLSTLKTNPIAWIFGYACEIDWIPSTLIDLSILEYAMALKKDELRSTVKIIRAFASALSRFSGDYPLCREENRTVPLKHAISLSVKPRKPGALPEDRTRALLDQLGWS